MLMPDVLEVPQHQHGVPHEDREFYVVFEGMMFKVKTVNDAQGDLFYIAVFSEKLMDATELARCLENYMDSVDAIFKRGRTSDTHALQHLYSVLETNTLSQTNRQDVNKRLLPPSLIEMDGDVKRILIFLAHGVCELSLIHI